MKRFDFLRKNIIKRITKCSRDLMYVAGIDSLAPPLTPAADEASNPWRQQPEIRPPIGRDPKEVPSGLADMLPDWVGYGTLYLISIAPVLIAISVVAILFFNSLR